jgi:cytosine/adenosine deaminase-related metal-dependent hydrolase
VTPPDVLLTGAAWALRPEPLADAAVLVRDARIAAVGPAEVLERDHPGVPVRSLEGAWLLPGLRNAHGHVAGWPRDAPVEVFLIARYAATDADAVHRATVRTALALLRSGVTHTHHLHYGPHAEAAIAAYREVGIGVELSLGALDRYSVLPYDDGDRRLLAALPPALIARIGGRRLGKPTEPVGRYLDRWRALHAAEHHGLVAVTLGPDNPQWCTDDALRALVAQEAAMHLHVQETPAQRSLAVARTGESPVARLDRLGVLGPRTTLAHLTSADPADIELVARSGASAAVNASSNLRLGSGIAPLRELVAAGIPVGLGSDGGGFADDLDALAELRLATLLQRAAGGSAPELDNARMLGLATGRIAVGAPADLVVLRPQPGADPIDALLARASAADVRDVYVAGRRRLRAGVPVGVREPADEPPVPNDLLDLSRELEPYVRALLAKEQP